MTPIQMSVLPKSSFDIHKSGSREEAKTSVLDSIVGITEQTIWLLLVDSIIQYAIMMGLVHDALETKGELSVYCPQLIVVVQMTKQDVLLLALKM
jgi:hypothetical protein